MSKKKDDHVNPPLSEDEIAELTKFFALLAKYDVEDKQAQDKVLLDNPIA